MKCALLVDQVQREAQWTHCSLGVTCESREPGQPFGRLVCSQGRESHSGQALGKAVDLSAILLAMG